MFLFFYTITVYGRLFKGVFHILSIVNPLSGKSGDTGINRDFLCVEDRQFTHYNHILK